MCLIYSQFINNEKSTSNGALITHSPAPIFELKAAHCTRAQANKPIKTEFNSGG